MDKKEKVYLFKVSLKFLKNKVYRQMAVKGTSSLSEFAEIIVNAFDFKLDHSYGFYSNIKDIHESNEAYTLFYDIDSRNTPMPNEKSVKNSYIYQIFEPEKKMLFLFDYGDEWDFIVECYSIIEPEVETIYPKIIKKKGEAPPQYEYPDPDDE